MRHPEKYELLRLILKGKVERKREPGQAIPHRSQQNQNYHMDQQNLITDKHMKKKIDYFTILKPRKQS